MNEEPIQLLCVRFLRYHQGMGANDGDELWVEKDWAERAIVSGIVVEVTKAMATAG